VLIESAASGAVLAPVSVLKNTDARMAVWFREHECYELAEG